VYGNGFDCDDVVDGLPIIDDSPWDIRAGKAWRRRIVVGQKR